MPTSWAESSASFWAKVRANAVSRATPRAPPTMLDILKTPAAVPASGDGTDSFAVLDIGVERRPSPRPTTTRAAPSTHSEESAESNTNVSRPRLITTRPARTGWRSPWRRLSRPPSGMKRRMPTVAGSNSIPASTAS